LSKIHTVYKGMSGERTPLCFIGKPNSKPGPMSGPKLIGGFLGHEVFGIWSLNNEACAHQGKYAFKQNTLDGSLLHGLLQHLK
jgi:hypothetical protein